MTDQADEFRKTAAQCLALAQITNDLHTRAALTLIAQRLHDLATQRLQVDVDAMVPGSDPHMTAASDAQPVTQQQQQQQQPPEPKKEE